MTRVRVLQSFTPDRGDISVNPYTSLLEGSLRMHCDVHRFAWPRALAGRYDVLHCHWPEHLIGNAQWLRRTVAQALFAVLLVVLRARRIAVVKTMHNVTPHESPSRISNVLLRRLDAMVDARIYLHEGDEVDPRSRNHVFPHGDYRAWYADHRPQPARPGRLAYFGRIQRYKNVTGLADAFAGIDDDGLRLVIAGNVVDPDLRDEIVQRAAADSRVETMLRPLSDAEVADVITGAEAVVLPYGYLYNSGSLLLALTLGRPVIVPASELATGMTAEVGGEWVATYDQPLDSTKLAGAVAGVRASAPDRGAEPDFTGRDWDEQARRLVDVYRAEVEARRG